ncbi:MAG TPA: L-threonylcarbamoyladenylate synthase [Hyphomicrobium sp.]|nr:L-threonylcarbamoyladenylate synthase [Hyphomicrobium sp.]
MSVRIADQTAIDEAGRLLREGALVAFPTETVYGLGADATNGRAVAGIFDAKGRPRFNPLIVHVPDLAHAEEIAVLSPAARKLAEAFWPGPLTLVLERRAEAGVSDLVSAGLDTLAVRVPAHPIAQKLLVAAGRPLAAPSANRSGRVSPTTAEHVHEDLDGRLAMILDGGSTQHGLESTVLDASGDGVVLLRPGAVPRDAIENVLGQTLATGPESDDLHPTSPGQLASHYAPNAAMRLNARDVKPGEALLAFGRDTPSTTGPSINLSATGDLVEAAAALFASLRALDRAGAATIAVMPIPDQGLGEAINDRLRRAAAPRPSSAG